MNRKVLIIISLLGVCLLWGCVKDLQKVGISETTMLKGRVVEESQNMPLPDVKVMLTDGKTIYLNATTNQNGEFGLEVDFERIDETSYLMLKKEDNVSEITKRLELKGIGKETYDYNDIFLYNLNDDAVPVVTTSMLADITETSATCGGNVTSDGGSNVMERGICWAIIQNPTTADKSVSSGNGTGSFTCQMSELLPNTTYYVRAYAINRVGVSYGTSKSFTTLEPGSGNTVPDITTNPVTDIAINSAVCGGNITSDGGATITQRGICWSTSANPIADTDITVVHENNGTGSYSCVMSELAPNTTYYVRAFATNEKGTAYGDDRTFTTRPVENSGWLGYGDESTLANYGWGYNEGGEDEWAVMFPSNYLSAYEGTSITKVKFCFLMEGEYIIRLYEGGTNAPETQVKAYGYNNTSTGWKTLLLNPPCELNTSKNLWVSFSTTYDAGHYPKSVLEGINELNARWNRRNGGTWRDCYDNNGGNDLCWTIRVYVTNDEKGEMEIDPSPVIVHQVPFCETSCIKYSRKAMGQKHVSTPISNKLRNNQSTP